MGILYAVDRDILCDMGQEQLVDDLELLQVVGRFDRHKSHTTLSNTRRAGLSDR